MKHFRKKTRNCFARTFFGVNSLVLTADNKYIVSGSSDKTIRILNFLEKTQETVLEGHLDSVKFVAVTRNNKYIVSGSDDRTIRIWNF